jgi:hypothetical protein
VLVKLNVVGGGVVSSVEIVGVSRELGGESVDTLDKGSDAERLAKSSDLQNQSDLVVVREKS